jgi:DNA-directed RNA polymerase specialized sigma24 family protein
MTTRIPKSENVDSMLATIVSKLDCILAVLATAEANRKSSGDLFAALSALGMSHAEIANLVGKTPDAIKMAASRARRSSTPEKGKRG